ncbi:hypothetical protein GCM10012287_54740 [Streptomyces daqingensis]|uniref:Cytochrome c oxidase assembly protein n=1 Tax=Streptomyces daqingensis TaxID=1472640 RepID=A0ABQ2MU08_9ACTN|nr:cytochrome c oxidase assembly protein [Streptomyces daqingensis]GGO57879.1 hypothetical protein GCM10012287_54740 [Streptomyces daqingensis]
MIPQVAAPDGGPGYLGSSAVAAALTAAAVYLPAAARMRVRGDAWPRHRDASFSGGCAALVYAAAGVLPGGPFTVHMAQHLLVAMAAPLLLAVGRPLTLALRVLPAGPVRRGVLAAAHSRPAAWLLVPPVAAGLDIGGMWLLYRTPLLAAAHHQPVLDALVHLHVLAVGLLFSFAVCQLDPVRRRWSPVWRGIALLAAGWAHASLAKSLYAAPPPGVTVSTEDLRSAAQLMYYGGDFVEVALAVVLGAGWYASAGRAHRRAVARHSRGGNAASARTSHGGPRRSGIPLSSPSSYGG